MPAAPAVHGEIARGWEPAGDAFAALFAEGAETGASAAAFLDGTLVADLWGGTVDRDSLVHVYSVTKPLAATCVLWLIDRGRFDVMLGLTLPLAAIGAACFLPLRAPERRAPVAEPA